MAISNELGIVTERLAFDPWGKRRYPNGLPDPNDSIIGLTTDRGFTLHEHLDEVGVIHMNGRIYDPLIGRFTSADPIIQAPGNLQNYNRYSYVMNNPLNLTDPSGFSFWTRLMRLGDRISSVGISLGSTRIYNASVNFLQGSGGYQLKSAALSFVSAFCYAGASACNAGLQYGLARGYGASESNAFKTGLIAGATTGGFTAAGGVGASDSLGRYAAHAAVGCASSVANGGGCGPGAAAALFGKFATNATAGWGVGVAQGAAAMVAGGVGSVIAGGKFENGAMTAAYGYLFNQLGNERTGSYKLEPVPDTPEMRAAYDRLQSLANTAAANVDATCGWRCNLPWIRGTLIHTEFEALVTNLGSTSGFTPEVSYKDGFRVDRGMLGSSRADVIYGPLAAPAAAYDLKTGWSYMSVGQAKSYGANLPFGTPFAIIRPIGR